MTPDITLVPRITVSDSATDWEERASCLRSQTDPGKPEPVHIVLAQMWREPHRYKGLTHVTCR